MAELLLDKGAEVHAKDAIENVPLYDATGNGHKEIVELLLDKGADINA